MQARAALYEDSKNWMFAAIMLAVLWYGFNILFIFIYTLWSEVGPPVQNPTLIDTFFEGSTPAAVSWTLASFAIYTAILLTLMRAFHATTLRDMIGPLGLAWRDFKRVSVYLLPLYAVLVLPSLFAPQVFQQYAFGAWLTLLPAVLPLLFVQISAEEFIFRGYLQSHLAALANHPVIWMGVPSVLFGLIHYDPTVPAYSGWSYVVWATFLGLVCADVTARSGTLGPALAVHFINNIGALLLLAADDWLYGAALFIWPTYGEPWEPWIPYDTLMMLCVWLCARLALRR